MFVLLTPSQFRDLISGRRRGAVAAMLRCGLRLAEVPYTWAVAWRNRRYDRGTAAVQRVGVPVVSVGNLTLGGTGKTPLVEWIARWIGSGDCPNFRLSENGTVPFAETATGTVARRVVIISRGYGARAGEANDEALELKQKLPDVPHLQNPDRVAAARQAVAELGCQAIVLDDGFQHRRIARDLDIVLLDALEPFGFGHVFPRGTLREPLAGLRRAHVVALSRADMLEPAEREAIRRRVAQYAPQADWLEIAHAAPDWSPSTGAGIARRAARPARGRVLRAGQPGRVPAHALGVRLSRGRLPRIPRSPPLHAGRPRLAGRVGRGPRRRRRALHAERHGQAGRPAVRGAGCQPARPIRWGDSCTVVPGWQCNCHPNVFCNFHPNVFCNFHPNVFCNFHPNVFCNFHPNVFCNFHPNSESLGRSRGNRLPGGSAGSGEPPPRIVGWDKQTGRLVGLRRRFMPVCEVPPRVRRLVPPYDPTTTSLPLARPAAGVAGFRSRRSGSGPATCGR